MTARSSHGDGWGGPESSPMYLFILVMMNRAKMVMLMTVTWSMSIWLPMLRWEMLEATTGCHSKSGTPWKDLMDIIHLKDDDDNGDVNVN